MNELEKLLASNQLEKLVLLTKGVNEPLFRLYYIKALVKLGDYRIALSEILENSMELYSFNALEIIKTHINILRELKEFDQALNVLKMYEDYPYISQEVNELIYSLIERVQGWRSYETKKKVLTLQEIERRLLSSNADLTLGALQYISTNYHESYVTLLQKVLLSEVRPYTKSLILFLLKDVNYAFPLKVEKFGKLTKYTPKTGFDPYRESNLKKFSPYLKFSGDDEHDITLSNTAYSIMRGHLLYLYPFVVNAKDIPLVSEIYKFLAINALGADKSLDAHIYDYKLNKDQVYEVFEKYYFHSFDI